MSTTAAPYGARPIGTVVGSPYQGKVTHYKIKNAYGTSIFYGDIVKLADDNPNTTINSHQINISQHQLLRMILLRMLLPIRL